MPEVELIPVANLNPDHRNPRHDIVQTQRQSIVTMLEDQKEKLVNLAEDIVNFGVSPSDLPIVMPDEDHSDFYVVLEGNRRITALKLLHEPSIGEGVLSRSWQARLEGLSTEFHMNKPVVELLCAVVPDRETANHWIRLRHTGENKGAGVVTWGSAESARFEARLGKGSPTLQALELVSAGGALDPSTRERLGSFKITNLTRLLNDPDVRQWLGVDISAGELKLMAARKEVLKGLTRIIEDLADPDFTVNKIRHKKDRLKYISEMPREYKPDLSVAFDPREGQTSPEPEEPPQGTGKGKRSRPTALSRATLIPKGCILSIENERLNHIYRELKKLEVKPFRNAASVMLRVFIELSLDDYLHKNPNIAQEGDKLKTKLGKVVEDLKSKGRLTRDEATAVNIACSNPNSIFSSGTLHAFVHNRLVVPMPDDLKAIWDGFQPFMEKLWA